MATRVLVNLKAYNAKGQSISIVPEGHCSYIAVFHTELLCTQQYRLIQSLNSKHPLLHIKLAVHCEKFISGADDIHGQINYDVGSSYCETITYPDYCHIMD